MKINIKIFLVIDIIALLICVLAIILGLKFNPLGYYVIGTVIISFIIFIILLKFNRLKN